MTDKKSPLHGLLYIDRPKTTWMQHAAFAILRHQKWASFFAFSLVILGSIAAYLLSTAHLGQELPRLGRLLWLLGTLILAQAVLFVCMFSDGGAARPWMIRTALASATDEERAFLFEQIHQRSQSHWRKEPLSCREVVSIFKEARQSYGFKTLRKQERLLAEFEAQVVELRAIAPCDADDS